MDDILNILVKITGEGEEDNFAGNRNQTQQRQSKQAFSSKKTNSAVEKSEEKDQPVKEDQEPGITRFLLSSNESPDFQQYLEEFQRKSV